MKIKGPYVKGEQLIYLVSYPHVEQQKEGANTYNLGKVISINKRSGQSLWISSDLQYSSFEVKEFDNYIVSADKEGYMVFLDSKSGKVKGRIFVGPGIVRPVIKDDLLFVLTEDKLYGFKNNSWLFKIRLMLRKVRDWAT